MYFRSILAVTGFVLVYLLYVSSIFIEDVHSGSPLVDTPGVSENIVEEMAEMKRLLKSALEQLQAPANDRRPTVMLPDGTLRERNLADRVDYLERKLAGLANWLPDPQLWRREQYICKNHSDWKTNMDMMVCLDGWEERRKARKGKPCVLYDLGIREQPDFGKTAATQYGCVVRAYDPSPTTAKWWKGDSDSVKQLKALGESRYKLWEFAAGGSDGPLELFEYNWQQVAIFKQELDLSLPAAIKELHPHAQKSIFVQAKTLPTMLLENHDRTIDVMKIDIEGSEYMFFQDIFDRMGCPPVQQITLEYHHFDLDTRYGSSPEVNTIHKLLNDCGFKLFYARDHYRVAAEHPSDKFYLSPQRYKFASYCKECEGPPGTS